MKNFWNSKISKRFKAIVQSDIRSMSIECEKINGINMSQGICDLPLPDVLKHSAALAIENGFNAYTRFDGLEELRKAIAEKAQRDNNIRADYKDEIVVSSGSTASFYCACLALLVPGDEVILFEPFYGYHVSTLYAVGADIKYIKMSPPNWKISIDDLEKAVSRKTKAIMINTPANPCGKIFTKEELLLIGEFCDKHNLIIFTDEIYEYIIYDDLKHISPASLPKLKERTITISGYSKTFSITGWRIGYSIASAEISEIIGHISDLIYVCAPAPLQMAVATAINQLKQSFYQKLRSIYQKKRDIFCCALKDVGLTPFLPNGAYYVLANASKLKGTTSKEKAMYLLLKTGIASVPGNAFYSSDSGNNILRFCFAKENEILYEACERLQKIKGL